MNSRAGISLQDVLKFRTGSKYVLLSISGKGDIINYFLLFYKAHLSFVLSGHHASFNYVYIGQIHTTKHSSVILN